MIRAIRLAASQNPHPNPRVGAVLLDAGGSLISEGAHERAGMPHAEQVALERAHGPVRGSTMVVTLEPCNHHGRTPPCTEALLDAGVTRVVVGMVDPDAQVSGRGIERLRRAGVRVDVVEPGPLVEELQALDPGYLHHRRTGRARVVLKLASTLDGQTGAADGSSQWITGEEARLDAHRLRASADAVMVGAGTLIEDDPRLDARLGGEQTSQPRPVIVAGRRALPEDARIWERSPIVVTASERTIPSGDLVVVGGDATGVDLAEMLRVLPRLGVLEVLAEGGATLAAGLLSRDLVDHGVTYLGSLIAGGVGRGQFDSTFETLSGARRISIVDVTRVGGDLRVDWDPAG